MRVPDILVRTVFEPLWDRYEGSVRLRTLNELRQSQWLPADTVRARQEAGLQAIVRHAAATSRFYRERFRAAGIDPAGVRTIADLAGLPLLTKADVRGNLDAILSTDYRKDQLTPAKTGGSTGVALNVFCDRRGVEVRNAAALRSDEWSGWRLGQPIAAIWGNPPVPRTLKNHVRTTLKDRIIYLDTMKIDDAAIDRFLDEWRTMKPGLLYGHAHSIFILAEALRGTGRAPRPSGIVATSMMLLQHERAVIEEVFGIPVTNRYGCEEVSLIACECEQHRGMHLNADHAIVEFLRDDGTPCAAGEDGRIVVTELVNRGMPMLRYEVGDRGAPSGRTCPCGRGLPLMEGLSGRLADFLVAADGAKVAGISLIENTLTKYPGIRQLQLVQERRLHVQANIVRGDEWNDETGRQLVARLQQALGENFGVDMVFVDAIPQESSGKYRFSICRI
ncbi:MAG TPA: phenylacetate--CoA ligase family protein [Candidatus Krumholzibacteria bacterium]|nr:phenylacetate--CoA ligase family protein [Candidatus Krumholzibacteria bacterium]